MKKETKLIIVVSVIALAVGFFLGRSTIETKEIVRYTKGETVARRVEPDLLKVKIEKPSSIRFLPYHFFSDTVKMIPDTARIINDFMTERMYDINLFDDQNGKLDIKPTLQYNRIQDLTYTFTPIRKETIKYREPLFTPFISGSYNTFGIAGIGGGLFYHDIGIEYKYLYQLPTNSRGHEVGVKWKF